MQSSAWQIIHVILFQQVMVANIRCGEILNDQLRALQEDQAWMTLVQSAQQQLIPDFANQASDLLESCLTGILHISLPPAHCAIHSRNLTVSIC